MDNPRILIAAGGTGGHVYPAIAIADAIKGKNARAEVLFVGTKSHMEWNAVPKAGHQIKSIWVSGLQRRLTLKNLLFPIKLMVSLFQSLGIILSFKPQVVVSCGGYVAGPIGWVAAKKNIAIVLQEQNSYPGVTNRMLAKFAAKIFTAFDDAKKHFPAEKVVLSGNPTRNTLKGSTKKEGLATFTFSDTKPVVMIMGGSLGARTINDAVKNNLAELKGTQLIWQCGSRYYDSLSTEITTEEHPDVRLLAFIDQMPEAYAAADLIISRAGASSCSELMITGKPSILVPSPNVAGDHQSANARSMVDAGAAVLLKDDEAEQTLSKLVQQLIQDEKRLAEMNKAALSLAKPNAADDIADEILTLAKARLN